jgi:hypothetical protein
MAVGFARTKEVCGATGFGHGNAHIRIADHPPDFLMGRN